MWYFVRQHMLNPLKSNISMHYIPHRCQLVSIRNTSHLIHVVCFWVIPRRLNFICQRFGTLSLSLFRLRRRIGVKFYTYLPMKMEHTECSKTLAYKIQTPGNYPEESKQHSKHSENLESVNLC